MPNDYCDFILGVNLENEWITLEILENSDKIIRDMTRRGNQGKRNMQA